MTTICCSQCSQSYPDDEFLCPYCGTAQIPQLSKAELREANTQASHGPYGAILVGTGIGIALGALYFVIVLLREEAQLSHGAGVLLGGMLGGAAGLFTHRLILARQH